MCAAGPVVTSPGIGARAGAALVFGSSAAVLVVELIALRLLAPYVGLTLEMNTIVIGIALAAIATGSWAGGRAADRMPPRRSLGPLLVVSGLAVSVTPTVVRLAGSGSGADGSAILLAGAACLFVPAALLSAVTPMVTKLLLTDLDSTGSVVGRLSGIGTAGGIAGTVLTGFVLVSALPVSTIMLALGVLLVVVGVVADVLVRRRRPSARQALAGLVVVGAGVAGTAAVPSGCDAETRYHCAAVTDDPDRDSGRTLVLDGVQHSYVDLDDPEHLEFAYVQAIASLADTAFAPAEPLDTYHLGGGGLTVPRYLTAVRPGTTSAVSEIDPGVVRLDRELLGDDVVDALRVQAEDGRLGLRSLATGSRDLVVGDAFGGVSVPWHLTTAETVADVRRVLRPGGVYAMNLIDHGSLAFARAAAATLADGFGHVAVAAEPGVWAGDDGGNLVAAASDDRLDLDAWAARMTERGTGWEVVGGAELADWIGAARVLTDDFAPVDQLLTPYARER